MTATLTALGNRLTSDQLIAPGEVIELRFKEGHRALSLRAAKLLHVLANQAGADAVKEKEHKILVASINFSHIETDELVSCVMELMTVVVELTYIDPDTNKIRTQSGPLLSFVDRPLDLSGDSAYILFTFSKTVRTILNTSNHWASISQNIILSFTSRYSLRLYEMISLRSKLGYKSSEEFDITDLRKRLGVERGKLVQLAHFKQAALDPAISEINKVSGFDISYETRKTGRKTSHITLTWSRKSMTERAQLASDLEALPLLEKHPAAAPISGSPESPQEQSRRAKADTPFPAAGSLRYGEAALSWRNLAYDKVKRLPGGHIPDLEALANAFRSWCARQNIPLDRPGIEKTFVAFCEKYAPNTPNDD